MVGVLLCLHRFAYFLAGCWVSGWAVVFAGLFCIFRNLRLGFGFLYYELYVCLVVMIVRCLLKAVLWV